MRKNWQFRLLALVLAIFAWYMVSGREKVDIWQEVPIEMAGMPDGLVIRSGLENSIDVRIRGPKGLIRNMNAGDIAYSLDLSGIAEGPNLIKIHKNELPLAKTFEVVEVSPAQMILNVDRLTSKVVEVNTAWNGPLDPDYRLAESQAVPPSVRLSGPHQLLAPLEIVQTRPMVFNGTVVRDGQAVEQSVELVLPEEVSADPGLVKGRLVFAVKTREMSFTVKPEVSAPWHKALRYTPRRVRLKVEVPMPLSRDKALKDKVGAELVVRAETQPGKHGMPYRVLLPEGCTLLEADPDLLSVTLQ